MINETTSFTYIHLYIMPKFVVRIRKSELVLLSADIEVNAQSADKARDKVEHRLAAGEEFEGFWFESDSSDAEEPIEIVSVDRANK